MRRMGFDVRANEINKFANYLTAEVIHDLRQIGWDLRGHALSTEGITGRIEAAVKPFLEFAEGQVDAIFEHGYADRARDLRDALKANALDYGAIDQEAERRFEKEYEDEMAGDKRPTGNKRFPRM